MNKDIFWRAGVFIGVLLLLNLIFQTHISIIGSHRQLFYRALIPPVVFTLSIVLAAINPMLAKLSWIAIGLTCVPIPASIHLNKTR